MCLRLTVAFISILSLMHPYLTVSKDIYCTNKVTQTLHMDPSGTEAYKIMTRETGTIGYTQNLDCKWILRVSRTSATVQIMINITTIDLAFVERLHEQSCSNQPIVDVFSMKFDGIFQVGSMQFSHLKWCSNWMAVRTGEILVFSVIASLGSLTVQFKSAERPLPADDIGQEYRGIEFKATVLKANYCEHGLLHHKGWCYFITNRLITFRQAWNFSQHATGELVAFDTQREFAELFQANSDRGSGHGNTPLDLAANKLVWIGNFLGSDGNVYATTSVRRCYEGITYDFAKFAVPDGQSDKKAPRKACRFAMSTRTQNLTCQDDDALLPALVRFPLVSLANNYDARAYPCAPPRDADTDFDELINSEESKADIDPNAFDKKFQIFLAGLGIFAGCLVAMLGLAIAAQIRDYTYSDLIEVNENS